MTDMNQSLNIFRKSLSNLQLGIQNNKHIRQYFPQEKIADILNTELTNVGLADDQIYDHQWLQRKFLISDRLLNLFQEFWTKNSISEKMRHQMCQLFFLHELYHLKQGIDSNTYYYSRNAKAIISNFDYEADAVAVKLLFLMETSDKPWRLHLAEILESHILCGEVFSYADDKRQESISGERLRRQLTWHFQLARAVSFLPESNFEEFDIESPLIVELLKVEYLERRRNLLNEEAVSPKDLESVEFQIGWQGKRKRHLMITPYFIENLVKGIFQYNFTSTINAFRAFFDEHLDLVGRKTSAEFSEADNNTDWNKLEKILVDILPEGPNQDEFWSRIGGDKSRLRTINLSGKAAWHNALNVIKNGGGVKLTILLDKLLEDYPDNNKLIKFHKDSYKL